MNRFEDCFPPRSPYRRVEHFSDFVADMQSLYDYLRSAAPPGQEIATLTPSQDPAIKPVLKTLQTLGDQLRGLSPEQLNCWPLRLLGEEGIKNIMWAGERSKAEPYNTAKDRIKSIILVMAEAWQDYFGSWPSSRNKSSPFFRVHETMLPEDYSVSPDTLADLLTGVKN